VQTEVRSVLCDRRGRLDPRRLGRAVGLLVDHRPELAGRAGADATVPSGAFVHLDLSTAAPSERSAAAEAVRWVLDRCLDGDRGTPFVVTYVDGGRQEPGCLVLAGRRSAVAGETGCAALVEALLTLYGELEGEPAPPG
jgi:hypothetical protein